MPDPQTAGGIDRGHRRDTGASLIGLVIDIDSEQGRRQLMADAAQTLERSAAE
jgi:hypothetical protein